MKSSASRFFGFCFKKCASSEGPSPSKSRRFLKRSTLGIAALFLANKLHFYVTKGPEFEHKLKLVFPDYHQSTDEGKVLKIVSENQIEHIIKLCNQYRKTLKCQHDHNVSAFSKGINVLVDYSQFDQIKKINVNTQKCKLEPGATFAALNRALALYGFYVPYVVPQLNEHAEGISVDQAVQENRLCLQSLRYGPFKETALERVGVVTGEGRMIQTGGYKVRDNFSFGYALNDLFAGSNYTLGLLFEVVVNCIRRKPGTQGRSLTVEEVDAASLPKLIANFKAYVQRKDDVEQSLVDAVILTNFNIPESEGGRKGIRLVAFDFSLNSSNAITDIKNEAFTGLSDLQKRISQEENSLDPAFVQRFAYASADNSGVDQEIILTLPLESAISFLEDYRQAFEGVFPFQMHLLKRYVIVKLCFSSQNEKHLLELDRLTSQVIKKGGTLKGSRKVLFMISPYLDKRIIGNYNMKVHNQMKQLFDPRDVLNPSSFFYLREKYEKSVIQKMKDKSKGINYLLSR